MSKGSILTPSEAMPLYRDIIPTYQVAFAGEPWYEVSKCNDRLQRCIGGLSSTAVGSLCELCNLHPTKPAYEYDELASRFDDIAYSRPTRWYIEQNEQGVTLAAIAWGAKAAEIAIEKYPGMPVMNEWLNAQLGDAAVIWLDEVFANKDLKSKGNLQYFGTFVRALACSLDLQKVAYRTIEPRMIAVAMRDFSDAACVYKRLEQVPDRRDVVIINLGKD